MFRDLFPSSKCLFLYRDAVSSARSFHRLSMIIPTARLAALIGRFSSHVTARVLDSTGRVGSDYRVRLDNELTFGVFNYALTTSVYLDVRRRGVDVSALRYEDLVARPLDACRVLMEFCGLPVSLAERAVTAFDVDSQRNSILARSVLARFKDPQLTPETKARLNELLKKYGVPLIGEPNILEGTLLCSRPN